MRLGIKILGTAIMVLAVSCTPKGETVEISKEQLMDKIKGGWAGQAIGCTYGGPTEFRYCGHFIPDTIEIAWPDHIMKWYYDNVPGLYDDIYMDLTFVDVFERLGLDAPVDSFAVAFAYADYPLWHANQQARFNIQNGIMPPKSGHWKHNAHADDIDFQIEADYAGLMSPGMPNAASQYADGIGHIMNYGDGWYGGVYVAAMYSLAFISSDVNYVVNEALKVIPPQSRYYKCMADIIRWHAENPEDWKATWQLCQDNYSENFGCPSGIGSNFNIDAVTNSAYILIGLLYGQGDFDRTIEISCRCGQDSDCNPASSGGILGTLLGYSKIPEKWLANLHEVEDRCFAYTQISLNKAYQMSYNQALKVIAQNGGTITDTCVIINSTAPEQVRFEQCFEGLEIKESININQQQDISFEFTGCGFTICGGPENQADIDILVDGEKVGNVKYDEKHCYRHEIIFQYYDLSQGHHTVTVKVNNPRPDMRLRINKVIVYDLI